MTGSEPTGGYTVAGLAVRTGITTSSVRYYLRQGLLRGDRHGQGQWLLEPSSAARVEFIRSAQERGLTLPEIADLLDPVRGEANRLDLVAEVDHRIAGLRMWRAVLHAGTEAAEESNDADDLERVLCS